MSVDMDVVGVMAAYLHVVRVCTAKCSLQRHVSALYVGHHQVAVRLSAEAMLACV